MSLRNQHGGKMYHRRKDFLMYLLEQLFKHIAILVNGKEGDPLKVKDALDQSFIFYKKNFSVTTSDSVSEVLEKLPALQFIDEYVKLLYYNYDLGETKDVNDLSKALELITYLKHTVRTYSWDRASLEQDILRLLEKHEEK